jgi:asparagine synthase (glutamine-hydrolysing)
VDLPESEDEVVDLLVARLRASVAEQRVADHPVGAYLSGGLDSSLLVTLMAEGASGPVHTFATADAPDHPDLVMARRVAEHLGTRHHERLVGPRELLAALPASVLALESTGLPSIAEVTAPEIRRHVKAALCGDGADELFAGYVMHARPGEWVSRFAQGFNRLVAGGGIRKEDAAPTVAVLHSLAPRLGLEGEGEGEGDLRERFYRFYLGAQLTSGHLRRWDLGTMAHGLELRVPYLSRPLRDLALALPWSHRLGPRATKRALRQAGKKILPPALAQEVIERRKLAAPAAYRRRARVLDRYLRRLLPAGWESQEHPLRPYYGSALERCLLDLFLFAFIARGGELPEGFQVGDLYQRHREELEAALESSWAASRRA